MTRYQMLVDGGWREGGSSAPVFNPATEEIIAEVPVASSEDVRQLLKPPKRHSLNGRSSPASNEASCSGAGAT